MHTKLKLLLFLILSLSVLKVHIPLINICRLISGLIVYKNIFLMGVCRYFTILKGQKRPTKDFDEKIIMEIL